MSGFSWNPCNGIPRHGIAYGSGRKKGFAKRYFKTMKKKYAEK